MITQSLALLGLCAAGSNAFHVNPGSRAAVPSASVPRMVMEPMAKPKKLDKVNIIKKESQGLREPVRSEFKTPELFINHDAYQILKFHGSYMQDDREKRVKGADKDYSFMLRLKMPAGECTPELYCLLDDLSREYGHGHLRLTTRQTFQLHGVSKHNLKHVIKSIMDIGSSTVGGCGDVNRNIMCTPAPIKSKPEYGYADKYSKAIADLLRPMSSAFTELWLDGEKAASIEFWRKDYADIDIDAAMLKDNGRGIILDHPEEPLYGDIYLPRKFKVAVTVPGDNSVDLYTNDIGLVVITNPTTGDLEGFNVAVGGGMGRTHNKETTFARTADHMGFVPKEHILECCKAILAAQRDHGNREVRANARMKYLVHTLGIDNFKQLVESYLGVPIQPWREIKQWRYSDWLGWHEQGDGKWFYGMNIEQGRIIDKPGVSIKKAIRAITDKYGFTMICTPNQSLLFKDIPAAEKANVESLLASHGILPIEQIDPLTRLSMACPALPMCGLAIAEAERVLPDYVRRVRAIMDSEGLGDEEFIMRMTGCPNGCARPYMAELAFVGDGPTSYQLWVGGCPAGTRTGYALKDRVKEGDIDAVIRKIMQTYKAQRGTDPRGGAETFGDFTHRIGKEALLAAIA
ncbi:unnamed protein product [Chrysoparadoxa australica]